MDFNRDVDNGVIRINQNLYIKELIMALRLTEANSKPRQMAKFGNFSTVKDKDYLPTSTEYKSVLGRLQFLASHTRPDIAHAVNYCARYQAMPQRIHWKLTQRIIRYLKGTSELGLTMATCGSGITGYADADHQQCKETRKSMTGYVVKFQGDTVAWKSTRQRSRGNSTTDSELFAVNACALRAKGLANVVYKIFPETRTKIKLYQDNTSTIKRTTDATTLGQYKEVDAKDKYVVQLVRNGEATVHYLATDQQLADPLTKPVDMETYGRHKKAILGSIPDRVGDATRSLTDKELAATDTKLEYFTLKDVMALNRDQDYHRLWENDKGEMPAPSGGVVRGRHNWARRLVDGRGRGRGSGYKGLG